MKHATSAALDDLEPLLAELRMLPGLTEKSRGVFYRRFSLPDSANPEGISASGKHGVLEIAIPKRAETKARRIDVAA